MRTLRIHCNMPEMLQGFLYGIQIECISRGTETRQELIALLESLISGE